MLLLMKKIRIAVLVLFFAIILIPVATFNREENVVSEIDNRALMNNPFGENYDTEGEDRDLTDDLETYVQDRIGFRDDMILGYTLLNDKLFHKMVHPTYDYGKDGYVFFKTGRNTRFGEFHYAFAQFIKKVQDYCDERGVPFVFVFNPAKTTVLSDELREGINYDAEWVQQFLECLDELGVNYIDNTPLMEEKTEEGEAVYNKVYNAGHWNDLGAFYGCNAILEYFRQFFPDLHINSKDDFIIEEHLNTSLMVSEFPIYEYEPVFEPIDQVENIADQYVDEFEMDSQYRTFAYYLNQKRISEGAPKVLSFQGSYMNGMGYKFLENSFGEYVVVHDYQNTLNLDYYFNIFQPDCVIFETAEYTLTSGYYNLENMVEVSFNEGLSEESYSEARSEQMPANMIEFVQGNRLTEIHVSGLPENTRYAYVSNGSQIFDLIRDESSYTATVEKANVDENEIQIIVILDTGERICYTE